MEEKVLEELSLIRKELQDIHSILESNKEYIDIQKAIYLRSIKEYGRKKNEIPNKNVTFQEALTACRQYLQEC